MISLFIHINILLNFYGSNNFVKKYQHDIYVYHLDSWPILMAEGYIHTYTNFSSAWVGMKLNVDLTLLIVLLKTYDTHFILISLQQILFFSNITCT